jgi:hypothetical protein
VAGTSCVKWHLPNSIHGEHRGRTAKCSIDKINHRVTYNYSKTIPLRIAIDRANNLSECPIEFEVTQEFPGSGGRDEKISLGHVRINLSEYIEESENFPRRSAVSRIAGSLEHARDKVTGQNVPYRKLSVGRTASEAERTGSSSSSTATGAPQQHPEESDVVDEEAEEGIVRRYLMQESKINSTLKIGILMVQVDGERNFAAPPLKSATVFNGGISGLMTGANELVDPDDVGKSGGAVPNVAKSRDASEAQDMYRRALAASWDCQPGELAADECIEDIFSGGSGWRDGLAKKSRRSYTESPNLGRSSSSGSGSLSTSSDDFPDGTLRPSHMRRIKAHMHMHSATSDKSNATVTGHPSSDHHERSTARHESKQSPQPYHRRRDSGHSGRHLQLTIHRDDSGVSLFDDSYSPGLHSRSESLTSLAPALGSIPSSSERGGSKMIGFHKPREIDEYELRDDLIAWRLPGTVT